MRKVSPDITIAQRNGTRNLQRLRMAAMTALVLAATAIVAGCGDTAMLRSPTGWGRTPGCRPHETLIPTVNIAPAKGWRDGAAPVAAPA